MQDGNWRVALARSIGTAHLATGLPCQDFVGHRILDTAVGSVIVAVTCDGAGSAPQSEFGSSLAGFTFIELVVAHFDLGRTFSEFDRNLLAKWLGSVRLQLAAEATSANTSPKDFACTLIAAIVGEQNSVFVQIGDGAIVYRDPALNAWNCPFWPQKLEYANTTYFVTSDQAIDKMQIHLCDGRVDEFSLFTDGLENLLLHRASQKPHTPFFEAVFFQIRKAHDPGFQSSLSAALERYLSSKTICNRTDDDKALVLATRWTVEDNSHEE